MIDFEKMAEIFQSVLLHNNSNWTVKEALRWRTDFKIISICAPNISLGTEKVLLVFLMVIPTIGFFLQLLNYHDFRVIPWFKGSFAVWAFSKSLKKNPQ